MNNPNLIQKMVSELPLRVQGQAVSHFHGKMSSVLICNQKINGIIEIRRGRNRNQNREYCYAVICNNHHGLVLCDAGGSGYSLLLRKLQNWKCSRSIEVEMSFHKKS